MYERLIRKSMLCTSKKDGYVRKVDQKEYVVHPSKDGYVH